MATRLNSARQQGVYIPPPVVALADTTPPRQKTRHAQACTATRSSVGRDNRRDNSANPPTRHVRDTFATASPEVYVMVTTKASPTEPARTDARKAPAGFWGKSAVDWPRNDPRWSDPSRMLTCVLCHRTGPRQTMRGAQVDKPLGHGHPDVQDPVCGEALASPRCLELYATRTAEGRGEA